MSRKARQELKHIEAATTFQFKKTLRGEAYEQGGKAIGGWIGGKVAGPVGRTVGREVGGWLGRAIGNRK